MVCDHFIGKEMKIHIYMACLMVTVLLLTSEGHCQNASFETSTLEDKGSLNKIWSNVKEGFDYTVRALTFSTWQEPADLSQNPNNEFLKLADYQFSAELRPDFRIAYGQFDFGLKPRIIYEWQKIVKGADDHQTDEENDFFINEWLARIRITPRLLVSYGRENIQWGPSLLSSPTNPFFKDNGRLSLKEEVRGSDFARCVWVPSETWSISFIANTGKGEQDPAEGFKEAYALKIDYIGEAAYTSLIGSYKRDDRARLGAYAGWTASDALLVYGEGMLQQGSEALYPAASENPLNAVMDKSKTDNDHPEGILVAGGSYTFTAGPTLTLEYLYHSLGYDNDEADQYYKLRENAADAYFKTGILAGLSRQTLLQTADPDLRFLRQNYLMLQVVQPDIKDVLSLTGRWLWNMDDDSSRLYAGIEYFWGDHIEWFAYGTYHLNGTDTEFGTFFKYQCVVGLEYVF
jgi:hypothetical protein